MSNRSCFILLLCLTLASKASAQARVDIAIYDYVGLSPAVQQQFVTHLESILTGAGVSVRMIVCSRKETIPCDANAGEARRLFVRVVPGQAKIVSNTRTPPLGQSIAGPNGGQYASVFLAPVQDRAADANVPWVTVLAYAAAHEIGHLLLGSGAHTPIGLMKGTWDRNDFLAMNQRHCQFNREQIRQLASHYGIDHQSQGQRREVARSCY
jgi:hypothetical protein